MNNGNKPNSIVRGIKKFFYSAFVAVTFFAYALENRGAPAVSSTTTTSGTVPTTNGATATPAGPLTSNAANSAAASPTVPAATAAAAGSSTSTATTAPTVAAATATSAATAATTSGYKDGTYTGSEVNVRWGYVQVQATIQGGQITNVQFLEYPNERNTSVRINSAANLQLIQEAIQTQSANVNIITGATLTSQGFIQSLQTALTQAKA